MITSVFSKSKPINFIIVAAFVVLLFIMVNFSLLFSDVNETFKAFIKLGIAIFSVFLLDFIISKKQLQFAVGNKKREALVVRTIPNLKEKKSKQYSNTNWPYFTKEAIELLVKKGIKHLLIDLPSPDREKDEGALAGHKAFWQLDGDIRYDATITEFIYVSNKIEDGTYFVNLQIAPFENDATPSKPILYKIIP